MSEPRRLKHGRGAAQRLLDSASLDQARAASRTRVAALVSTNSAFSQTRGAPPARPSALRAFSMWTAIGAAASLALGFAVSRLSDRDSASSSLAPAVTITPETPRPIEPWADAGSAPQASLQELQDFERARAAIARGDGQAALQALTQFQTSAPSSLLRDEVTVLRVQALQLSGQHAAAREQAAAFVAEHPSHPLLGRVQALDR